MTKMMHLNLCLTICSDVLSREKLWICMEYCGGGSLQDIYHGEMTALKCFVFSLFLNSCPANTEWNVILYSDGPSVGASDSVCQQRDYTGIFSL